VFLPEGIHLAPIQKCGSLLVFGAMLAYTQNNPQSKPQDAVALNNSGVALRLASRPTEASEAFRRALKIAGDTGDDRLLATVLGGLGATLVDLGEFARAQPVLRRSLALFEKTAGPDSIEAGEAANNLAMVYRKNGDLAQAQMQLERALPLMEKYLGNDSPALAMAYNNMFIVLVERKEAERKEAERKEADEKQWANAELYLMRALEIAKVLPESVQLAEIEENLALLEAHRGQFHEAAQTMELVIAIEERTLKPEDPRMAQSLESYSGYLKKINRKAQARLAADRAKAIRRAVP
jgi:tetratricopeptide (TPR) repeat protein